jgi:hypothetical protein
MDNVQEVHKVPFRYSINFAFCGLCLWVLYFISLAAAFTHMWIVCFYGLFTLWLFMLLVCFLGFWSCRISLVCVLVKWNLDLQSFSFCMFLSVPSKLPYEKRIFSLNTCAFYKISQICLKTEHIFCNFKYLEMRNIRNQKYKTWVSLYIFFNFVFCILYLQFLWC